MAKSIDIPALILTWFGCGRITPLSGTWGTLGALPVVLTVLYVAGPLGLVIFAALLYMVSLPMIAAYEKDTNEHDDSAIVVDEVIGIAIALLPATFHFIDILVAFLLFRMFDGLKPGPIGWIDRHVKGAHGVLVDDVAAGLATALCIVILHWLIS